MMAQGRLWTGAEEKRLRDAIEGGIDRLALCELLGREQDTIRRKCKRLGLQMPRAVKQDFDRVIEPTPDAMVKSYKALGDAINALRARLSPWQLAKIDGTTRAIEPGQERALQTCAVERLAA